MTTQLQKINIIIIIIIIIIITENLWLNTSTVFDCLEITSSGSCIQTIYLYVLTQRIETQ